MADLKKTAASDLERETSLVLIEFRQDQEAHFWEAVLEKVVDHLYTASAPLPGLAHGFVQPLKEQIEGKDGSVEDRDDNIKDLDQSTKDSFEDIRRFLLNGPPFASSGRI